MLINADVRGLEIAAVADLSGDPVLMEELWKGEDIHGNNQQAFGLPSRLIAKVFKFRLIYGGTEFSYARDPDFIPVSSSPKYWRRVIDSYYNKYQRIESWHAKLIQTARVGLPIEIPTGRYYRFVPTADLRGGQKWPETLIKNYPVQGFGADMVLLGRMEAYNRLKNYKDVKLCGTIHDSIVADAPKEQAYEVGKILLESVHAIPSLLQQHFDYKLKVPVTAEIQIGKNKADMLDITKELC